MHYPEFNISIREITSCKTQEFEQLYAIYARAFPLEDEREKPEAFETIILFNNDVEIQKKYGHYYEVVSAIHLGSDQGKVIGGIIFGVASSKAHTNAGVPVSIQAIYAFVDSEHRGLFPMRLLTEYCRKVALDVAVKRFAVNLALTPYPPIIFLEINNPLKMDDGQIDQDTQFSGVSPYRRYIFWQNSIKSMPLDFTYIQPRLSENLEPIFYLDLFCTTNELPNGIPADLLFNHLKAFASISVLKNHDASKDADFMIMEQSIKSQKIVPFLSKDDEKIRQILEKKRNLFKIGYLSKRLTKT